jgi:aryl-alcohol dehydrogenase-like predicted oxidoreductase
MASLDRSLTRLATDHVDLWQIQVWDTNTPLEDTLSALDWAYTSGRARYVGVSNFSGWQSARAITLQEANTAKAPIATLQNEFSLLNRTGEADVLQCSSALNRGFIAWSPLGRGVLTGKYRNGTPADSRGASQHFANFVAPYMTDSAKRIVEALAVAADGLGRPMLDTALAWVLAQPQVATAIVGARTAAQIRGIMAADFSALPEGIHAALSDVSAPPKSYPEYGWNQS